MNAHMPLSRLFIFLSAVPFAFYALYRIIRQRVIPFVELYYDWSIGVAIHDGPVVERAIRPPAKATLSRYSTGKKNTLYLADPFLVAHRGEYLLFYEIVDAKTNVGEIAVSRSRDGKAWTPQGTVLKETFHLSYPHVFEWEGEYYMVPETGSQNAVYLYKAHAFPDDWRREATLLEGLPYNDASVFRHDGRWWMFAGTRPYIDDTLCLYHADSLKGPWRPHPKSPVMANNPLGARPAGRVLSIDGRLYRFGQVDAPYYGQDVLIFEITRLTRGDYDETLVSQTPWNLDRRWPAWIKNGRHHLDSVPLGDGRWLTAFDGFRWRLRFNRARNLWPADVKRLLGI